MSVSPLFTVVLPVRNGGDYLKECVASILGQNLGDLELVVLDSGSTDGTLAWLHGLTDPRVHVRPGERALSIEENWARILSLPGKGEFLTLIGHDDLLDPGFLETMSGLIRQHPQAGLYQSHFRLIDKNGTFLRHCRPMPERESAAEFLAARFCWMRDSFGTGYVMRSADYERVGGIPPFRSLLHADDALWAALMAGTYKATALVERFSYRTHSTSAATASGPVAQLEGLEAHLDFLRRLASRCPDVAAVVDRYAAQYFLSVGQHVHHRMLERALRSGVPYPEGVRRRLETLCVEAGAGSPTTGNGRRMKFMEWCARHAGAGRLLHRLLTAGEALPGRCKRLFLPETRPN